MKMQKKDDLPDDMLWSVDDGFEDQAGGRISQVPTRWAVIRDPVSFFQRYEHPIRSFFIGLTRDESASEDLFQDFAVKVLRGKFQPTMPLKGRYRDYLCRSLINHVKEARRRAGLRQEFLDSDLTEDHAFDDVDPLRQAMSEFHRSEGLQVRGLVEEEMRRQQVAGRNVYLALLRYLIKIQTRKLDPQRGSTDGKVQIRVSMTRVARFLTRVTGRPFDEASAAQYKHRAVREYAQRIIRHLVQRAESQDPREIRQCAQELELLAYCGAEIERMKFSENTATSREVQSTA